MQHAAAEDEWMVDEIIRRKKDVLDVRAREQLSPIFDHVSFTLQKAYFRCAYECFDRKRRQEDINNCVEYCRVPVLNANNLIDIENKKFDDRLQRAVAVCRHKFKAADPHQTCSSSLASFESCVDQAIQDSARGLPHVVDHLWASLSSGDL